MGSLTSTKAFAVFEILQNLKTHSNPLGMEIFNADKQLKQDT